MDDTDEKDLLNEHKAELKTEELQDLQQDQQKHVFEEPSSREDVPSSLRKKIYGV